jgi:hypothetical protein
MLGSLTTALEKEIARSAAAVDTSFSVPSSSSLPSHGSVPHTPNGGELTPVDGGGVEGSVPRTPEGSSSAAEAAGAGSPSRGFLSSIKKSTRASFRGAISALGLASPSNKESGSKSGEDVMTEHEKHLHLRLDEIGRESQKCQQNIIIINRSFASTESNLQRAYEWYNSAALTLDEAKQWNKSLCDQLQLLVEDTNRHRSQKLQHVANNYIF